MCAMRDFPRCRSAAQRFCPVRSCQRADRRWESGVLETVDLPEAYSTPEAVLNHNKPGA